ncbi:hypothetical protein D9615_004345 [Tricholomella constricta]|uniref:Glucose-methanol-choline oxidoreductase N-terminal domain-containing protein n=1 Tax=Tricholomella constricta TaxID=117010 RepID=A0A8H5HES9_9AGAR|nr:hypothetical protein D9615_004345 [Tricholomella constricta]
MVFPRPLTLLTPFVLATAASSAALDAATFASTPFDFIVAGGGTAGVAVAVRLSEIANATVGIIEAGTFNADDPRIMIPQGTNTAGLGSNGMYSWNFRTTPQAKLNGRSLFMARGKVLGGSSAINLLGLALAGAVEYDQIGQLGNPGWSYQNTLKYFKKATNMSVAPADLQRESHATFSPKFHGTSGPIKTSFSSWFSQAIPPFYNAMVKLGFVPVQDGGNGLDSGTVWNPPLNIDQETKTRSYSAVAYYLPNAGRPNLHLLTNAQVIKINLSNKPDASGKYTATGVTYISNGVTHTASVRKDVIVSAGSVQSPQLLELSGIGNKTILEAAGVKSLIDLPGVGENYQDHLITTTSIKIPNTIETWDIFGNPVPNATAFSQYETNRTGPYASSINVVAFGSATKLTGDKKLLSQWLQSIDKQFNASNPSPGRRAVYEIERKRLMWNDKSATLELYCAPALSYPQFFEPNTSYVQIASIQTHPFSRGSIHLNSSNPLAPPLIDLNAWAFDIDKQIHIQGAKYARMVTKTAPFSKIVESYVYPGLDIDTDQEWESFISNTIDTPFHPTGTNAMLPKAYGGVVDPKLKVYGTNNIRVVDVSILPFNLATHLAGTAYAIAEQAADIIKVAHGYRVSS